MPQMVRIRPPMLRFLYELSDEEYVKSSSAAPSSSQASSSSQGAGPSNLQHAFTIRNGAVVSVPAAIGNLQHATVVPEVKEAEGYKLFLSSNSQSGYRGVTKEPSGRFKAYYWDKALDKHVCIGTYDTVVEAAVAYAKHMAEKGVYADALAVPVVKEAEGYKLFLSRKTGTGYLNVIKHSTGRFMAQYYDNDLKKLFDLGKWDTPVEAAVVYAKHMAEKGIYPDENEPPPPWLAAALEQAKDGTVVREASASSFSRAGSATGYKNVIKQPNDRFKVAMTAPFTWMCTSECTARCSRRR